MAKKKNNNNTGCGTWLAVFLIIGLIGSIFPDNDKNDNDNDNSSPEPTQYVSEKIETPTNLPTKTQLPKNPTEKEYKDACKEYYNDDFFKDTPKNNTYVKFYGFTGNKYKYSASDIQGIIVEDITDEYNLERNCIGCTVMHESTKNDKSPNYFGDSVYIMFEKDGKFKFDDMMSGKYITVYGEIIQNKNGIYILPKYIEYTK